MEPRSHFKSRLSLIVRVNIVLNKTVVVDSDWRFNKLCGSHLQSQSESYHVSWWYYTLVIGLIGQLRCDVIGRLSVKPWCYGLRRLIISNWCVSIRLKQSSVVSQIVSSLVVLSRWYSVPEDVDYRTVCRIVSLCQQQESYWGLRSPRTIKLNLLLIIIIVIIIIVIIINLIQFLFI